MPLWFANHPERNDIEPTNSSCMVFFSKTEASTLYPVFLWSLKQ